MPKITVTLTMHTEDFDDEEIDLNHESGLSSAGFERLTGELSEYGDDIEFNLEPQSPIKAPTPDRRLKKKPRSGPPAEFFDGGDD